MHVVPLLIHSGLQDISIFDQKLPIRTTHHTFLQSRQPAVTKNLYYVLSTRRSQIPIFLVPAQGLYIMKLGDSFPIFIVYLLHGFGSTPA